MAKIEGKPRRERALDWAGASMMLLWGATLLMPGQTFGRSAAYSDVLRLASEAWWGGALLGLGLARGAALIINGRLYEGSPAIRGLAALLGVVIWIQFAYAFGKVSEDVGAIVIGFPTTLGLAGMDLWSAMRSSADFINARRARRQRKGRAGRVS